MQIQVAKPNWARVGEVKDVKISKSLLYKWHHRRENTHLFTKVGGCLFVDLAALDALFEAGRGREA